MSYPLGTEVERYKRLKADLLAAMPELEDDPECLLDTLEGLSNINEMLASVLRGSLADAAQAKGIDEHLKNISNRKIRFTETARKKRAVVLSFMADLNIKKIEAPDFTASRRVSPAGVIVTDMKTLPDEFVRTTIQADKSAIKRALKQGREIPGALLGNEAETLSIRT